MGQSDDKLEGILNEGMRGNAGQTGFSQAVGEEPDNRRPRTEAGFGAI